MHIDGETLGYKHINIFNGGEKIKKNKALIYKSVFSCWTFLQSLICGQILGKCAALDKKNNDLN